MAHLSGASPQQRLSLVQRLRERLQSLPLPDVEDSWVLRALVQALVVVGILATDVAAADVGDPRWVSVWAIPASIGGAFWSWRHRRDRNITVKFLLAISMLVMLAAFLGRLVGQLNDSRLLLAELLIQLQVLHSFDLPRRKDLGYSMVIGLILLAVAATVSQTLSFAPMLILFLAIALPVLTLDYRSRLGVVSPMPRQVWKETAIAPKRLGMLLGVVICLGLVLFAALPRLPGYRIRTFPVSATIDVNGEFDSREIVNPGYVGQGRDNGRSPTGEIQGGGRQDGTTTVLDNTQYYGFNTEINQNFSGGQMEPQVMLRVRSQARGFWRMLAFDQYLGQGWEISRNNRTQTLDRPAWSYRFLIPGQYITSRSQEVVQTFTVVKNLPNLVPALAQLESLYFPTRQVAIDTEGGVRSPIELTEGVTYTAISRVPYRDRTALKQTKTDYPKKIQTYYLQVPEGILDPVRRRTWEILATSPTPIVAPSEKALYLAQYLKQYYTIQPDWPALGPEDDLVESFLFKTQGGYPDHFPTVLTMMLRSIGIPARLVVGFAPGEFNPFTGFYLVRNTDAYAMTEVYFPGQGWFGFDPIPGHDLIPPSVENNETFSTLQRLWAWATGWLPSPVRGLFSNVFSWIEAVVGPLLSRVIGVLTQGWLGVLVGLVMACGLGLMGWLTWLGWRQWQYRRWLMQLPAMERLYQQMVAWLSLQGWRKHPAQTPFEYAQQVGNRYPGEGASVIGAIAHAYVAWRYGGKPVDVETLRHQAQILKPRSRWAGGKKRKR